jgi:hypothetical protein
METAGTMLARNNRCTSILGASTLSCHVSPLMGIRRFPAKTTHLAAFAPEPTKRLMPTLFAFLPFSCACIGCSCSHLSSSLYASIAASRLQSACCMYNVATSYLEAGGILVSLSVPHFHLCASEIVKEGNCDLLGDLASHHPSSHFVLLDFLFLAF